MANETKNIDFIRGNVISSGNVALPGIIVRVINPLEKDPAKQLIASTKTQSPDGSYAFAKQFDPGPYVIQFEDPQGKIIIPGYSVSLHGVTLPSIQSQEENLERPSDEPGLGTVVESIGGIVGGIVGQKLYDRHQLHNEIARLHLKKTFNTLTIPKNVLEKKGYSLDTYKADYTSLSNHYRLDEKEKAALTSHLDAVTEQKRRTQKRLLYRGPLSVKQTAGTVKALEDQFDINIDALPKSVRNKILMSYNAEPEETRNTLKKIAASNLELQKIADLKKTHEASSATTTATPTPPPSARQEDRRTPSSQPVNIPNFSSVPQPSIPYPPPTLTRGVGFQSPSPLTRLARTARTGRGRIALNGVKFVRTITGASFFLTPPGLFITIGVAAIGIILLLLLIMSRQNEIITPPIQSPTFTGLTIELTDNGDVANEQPIEYTVTVTYAGNQDLTVEQTVPENTEFVSSTGTFASEGATFRWNLNANLTTGGEAPPGADAPQPPAAIPFPVEKFREYGFPDPNDSVELTPQEVNRWKTYLAPQAVKAGQLTGTDPGIIGMWYWLENRMNPYSDNCFDQDSNPNTPCYHFGRFDWQVGGVHVGRHLPNLQEAFNAMHPGETPQAVGQKVIDLSGTKDPNRVQITWPGTTFPSLPISEIVTRAERNEIEMRTWASILMKDDGISAYLIGKTFFETGLNQDLADRIAAWPPPGYYAKDRVINVIKGIYDIGIDGSGGDTGPGVTGVVRNYSFKFTVKPLIPDINVIHKATIKSPTVSLDTEQVITKVGNAPAVSQAPSVSLPPSTAGRASCPIQEGPFNCGSKLTPRQLGAPAALKCGHCAPTYPRDSFAANCTQTWAPGTASAVDIGGPEFTPVYLPSIDGNSIDWTFLGHEQKASNQTIMKYRGFDSQNEKNYYLQFHHVAPPGPGEYPFGSKYKSGDRGARVCGGGCGMVHVHVQIGSGTYLDNSAWLDSGALFACRD